MEKNKRSLFKNALWIVATVAVAAYALAPTISNQVARVKPATERSTQINFKLTTLDGGKWSLADYRGKVVLVNFWASWCPPCRMETPDLVNVHNKYAARGFSVVGITLDETPNEDVPPFVKRYGIPYPILLPSPEVGQNITSLPTSLLIDRSGRVAKTYHGIVTESALERDVEALLGERI